MSDEEHDDYSTRLVIFEEYDDYTVRLLVLSSIALLFTFIVAVFVFAAWLTGGK